MHGGLLLYPPNLDVLQQSLGFDLIEEMRVWETVKTMIITC